MHVRIAHVCIREMHGPASKAKPENAVSLLLSYTHKNTITLLARFVTHSTLTSESFDIHCE